MSQKIWAWIFGNNPFKFLYHTQNTLKDYMGKKEMSKIRGKQ